MSAIAEIERIQEAYARRRKRPHSFVTPSSVFMSQETERHFLDIVRKHGLDLLADARLLDVGGGGGFFVRSLLKYGVRCEHLYSVDLWESRLHDGHMILPSLNLACADGSRLPFADSSFDLVIQRTMLSSITSPDLRHGIAAEMLRVLKRDGAILSYDMRFIRPGDHDMCAMNRSELKRLFPGCGIDLRPFGMPPVLARFLAPRSFALCQMVSSIWPIKTHYWAAIRNAAWTKSVVKTAAGRPRHI